MKEAKDNGSTDLALQATGEPFMDKRLPEFIKEEKDLSTIIFILIQMVLWLIQKELNLL